MTKNFDFSTPTVAYFSMEFALTDKLPIYSGGLGVLAADTLFEAADQRTGYTGIGIFFHKAYMAQTISDSGDQIEQDIDVDPIKGGLEKVLTPDGSPLEIQLPIAGQSVRVHVWKYVIHELELLLLDTHVEGNTSEQYNICNQLYQGESRHRIEQEMLLGIGGVRVLSALNRLPEKYHLNEGHSSFAIFEIAHEYRKKYPEASFGESLRAIRGDIVFVNHTIVPAGNDGFHPDELRTCFSGYGDEIGVSFEDMLEQGFVSSSGMFSMPHLAMRNANHTVAVSELHATVADKLWPEVSFIPVTNGVYAPRWTCPEIQKVWALDSDEEPDYFTVWDAHQSAKQRLFDHVEEVTGTRLDPNVLTIGWARRVASYKRPQAVVFDFYRLCQILNNTDRPVQILMAGKAHSKDLEGRQHIKDLHNLSIQEHRFQYVPNYNLELGALMVAGTDVWLNTPERGYEACGTSGMKACLNGVLQLTTRDGWTDEVNWNDVGWKLNSDVVSDDIYNLLENEITELYYKRDKLGIPEDWIRDMIASMHIVRNYYTTERMLEDYYTKLYRD